MPSRLLWIHAVYSHLLRLYPKTHRELFAAEMAAVFEQAVADAAAQGGSAVLWLCLRELRDLPLILLTEHWAVAQQWAAARLVEREQLGAAPPGIVPVGVDSWRAMLVAIVCCNPRARRLFDVAMALVGILMTAPILLLLPLLIKLDSGGPILYRQTRLGKDDRSYAMFKFRSMHVARPLQSVQSPGTVADCDPRVTRIGRLTRHFHLDEIPQLFNVLKGEMSIFGARPGMPQQH